MKKAILLLALLVVGFSYAAPKASEDNPTSYSYGKPFIFVEGGVEFAIYPDGQFDFFYNRRGTGYSLNVISPNINISFNSGYNYNPYVQYDDFGAVIQIAAVPIYYDYYGRIIRAGNVVIAYNHFGRIARIGGMHLFYNPHQQFTNFSGFINARNARYIARPWHRYYTPPHAHVAVVYHQPYRAYYFPSRMKYPHYKRYYKKHYKNDFRRRYYSPGEKVVAYHRGRRAGHVRDLERLDVDDVSRSERNRSSLDSDGRRNRSNRNSSSSDRTSTRNIRESRISSDKSPIFSNRTRTRTRKEVAPSKSERRTVRSSARVRENRKTVQPEARRSVRSSSRRATTIERDRSPNVRAKARSSRSQKARVRSSRSSRGR